MIEFIFPNSRALLPTFCTNCLDGSDFAQMGSHFAQNITPNPCSFLSCHTPVWGYIRTQTPPTPPQNPLSFESGQNELALGQSETPSGQYI